MKKFKTVLLSILLFFIYLIPGFLFKANPAYYASIPKPTYAPPAILFGIIWPILFAIFSIYIAIKIYKTRFSKEMTLYFIINYIASFFFNKAFFLDHNLFLSFTITFSSFISGLFLFLTTFKYSKKEFFIFLPYLIWTGFASFLMAQIYLLN